MSYAKHPARGLVGARADADPVALIAQINQAVTELRATHDAALKNQDVVLADKTTKINADISALSAELDRVNKTMAAIQLGGAGAVANPAQAEHAQAFNRFFRNGVTDGLGDLQVKAALSTSSNPDGGYLVPVEMENAIDRVLGTVSTMRSLSNVMTIGLGDTYKLLVNQGGTGAGWVGETDARPVTATPTLKEIAINLGEMYANPSTTQRALDDARIDLAAWLADEVSITFAEQEGAAFISGDGVNKPRGILSYPTIANASYAWGSVGFEGTGTSGGFGSADSLMKLHFALKAKYRANASFLMSDATAGVARLLKDGQGNYLWKDATAVGEIATFAGKPVATDDNMPALAANSFSVAFGDFRRAYQVVDKAGVTVLRDPLTNKPNVSFYTTKRVGGGIRNFEAIKLLKFI